jgi:ribosomal protein S18 acetylase RimI-like enzyme
MESAGDFRIQDLDDASRRIAMQLVEDHWGSTCIVTRGRLHEVGHLAGVVAVERDELVGLATYRIEADACELVTLNSLKAGIGIGSALVDAVRQAAARAGCRRLWLITTNDNMAALRFYQKHGFSLVAVYPDAMEQSRRLKPDLPRVGLDGIPLRDEIELEMRW